MGKRTVLVDASGQPLLSWRVLILPFMGYQQLYDSFRLDEPWDSPHNRKLLELMPPEFDTHPQPLKPGFTGVLAIVGEHTSFPPDGLRSLDEFSNPADEVLQVICGGARRPVEWTRPEDLELDAEGATFNIVAEELPGAADSPPDDPEAYNLVMGLFGDGTSETLDSETSTDLLRQAVRINDGSPQGLCKTRR